MFYIFLAVLAVLLVMNMFMLIVLRQMTGATGRQIEKDAGRLFGVYDEMLEEKSRKLEALRHEEAELEDRIKKKGQTAETAPKTAVSAFTGIPPVPAEFQDKDFARMYGMVKSAFSVSGEAMADAFSESLKPERADQAKRRELLEEMRKLLDFDSLYRILVLPPDQQKQVLESVFSGENGVLYREWEQKDGTGGVLGFSDWLDRERKYSDRSVVVKTSKEDPSICEGVKILYQDQLYDYSV